MSSLALRHVTLRVADLARSVDFYGTRLGFVLHRQDTSSAVFGTSADAASLLTVQEERHAPRAAADTAGLYHVALLLPSRASLGGWLHRAVKHGVTFDGASDHLVSEAIYFSDPDGNGLEFYADRPREEWPMVHGQIEMATRPCNIPSLLEAGKLATPPLAGATWGHLHLRVIDLDKSEAFYAAELGMQVTQRNYPGARFLAADGYHHHLGLNTWGRPRHTPAPGALGLVSATFARRDISQPVVLSDPNGIAVRVEPLP